MSFLSTASQSATGNQFINAPRSRSRNSGSRGATGAGISGNTGGNVIPKGYKYAQLGQFTPEQQQLFQRLFGQVGPDSFLSRLAGGDQSQFEQLEAPALQQFNALQGNLASRFSGAGLGGRHSSGFQQASNQATSDFAQQLQAQRLGLQRQALFDMQNISHSLLGERPYQQFLSGPQDQQNKHSWIGGALPFAGAALGGIAGGIFGGPPGALLGAKLGGGLGAAGSKAFF